MRCCPSGIMRGMVQFSLKRLFASTAIAAVGVSMLVAVRFYRERLELWSALLIVLGAGACFGAAALTPFKRPWIGAFFGALAMLVYLLLTSEMKARY
jgi:hypothetical protein